MRTLHKLWVYLRVFARGRRHQTDLLRWLLRRPQLLVGTSAYEIAQIFSSRVETRLKKLAELHTAALVHCQFCLDIGSALAHYGGISERQLRELRDYQSSDAFDTREKLVLSFAQAMTTTPSEVDDELRTRLLEHFTRGQLAELASAIAWENQRARLNEALGVRPAGFADGLTCALPQPHQEGRAGRSDPSDEPRSSSTEGTG